jgi:hypothetical protein
LARGDSATAVWTWELSPGRPRSRYGPSYVDHFTTATRFQLARFPRGDTTFVVAGIDTQTDTALRSRPFDLTLSLSAGPRLTTVVRRDSTRSATGLIGAFRGMPAAASIEVTPTGGRRFLRARMMLPAIDRSSPIIVSDPLLFAVHDELPTSLDQAASRALPSTRFSKAQPVGVYWEAAGEVTDSVAIALAVVPMRRGLLGRIGEGLSVVGRRAPLTLQWRAGASGLDVAGRAVELDVRRLRTGRYLLRLEARLDHATAVTETIIELTQ